MAHLRIAVLLVLAVLVMTLPARGEEALDAFSAQFGEEYKKVLATRDPADDIALAAQFIATAKDKVTPAALAAILCEKAHELAAKTPAGYDRAVEAMGALAQKVPEKRAGALDKIIVLRQKQFEAAAGPEMMKAGQTLIEALFAAADAKSEAGSVTEPAALQRRAIAVAGKLGPGEKAQVQDRVNRATTRQRFQKEAQGLKARLAANAQDAAARKKLISLLVVELDDPAQASTFLDDSCDEAMRKFVPAAAKPVEDAPQLACKELGDWYSGLAETAAPGSKPPMLVRSWQYYERYLRIHTAEDLPRAQTAAAMKKAEDALDKLSPPSTSGPIGPGRWVDILKVVDPKRDSVNGNWALGKEGWLRVNDAFFTGIRLPCAVYGSYQVRITLMVPGQGRTVVVMLPVASTKVSYTFCKGAYGGLSSKGGGQGVPLGSPKDNQDYVLDIKVVPTGDQAEVIVDLDGKPHFRWQGPQSALGVDGQYKMADPTCPAVGTYETPALFKGFKLRMISGTATLLRTAAEVPPPTPTPPKKP